MGNSLVVDILLAHHGKRDIDVAPYTEYADILKAKADVLERFQTEFATNAIEDLSAETFRDFLSFKHNRHWTGLHRAASHVCEDMPKLRAALRMLFNEDVSIVARIDSLTEGGELSVRGMAKGILTSLLLVRFPTKYGVWNGKAEGALKLLGIWPKFPRGATEGQKYAALNSILLRLSAEAGLDLWTLDGLWHVINETTRREVAEAFEQEEADRREFYEGARTATSGYRYERDADARTECIEHHGTICVACGFDFFEVYGELGLGFIHVHHVTDIAVQGVTKIDPKVDLVPVCPNCHAMLHRNAKPARSVDDLKQIIAKVRGLRETPAEE